MKQLLSKLVLLVLFVIASYGIFVFGFVKIDKVDRFYPKISSPKVSGLILGSSRGFYGLATNEVFEGLLEKESVINFAFTLATSPYGSTYLNAVKRKVDPNTKEGFFVLETSPLGISVKDSTVIEEDSFREKELMLSYLKQLNNHPNFEYLFSVMENPLYKVVLESFSKRNKNIPSVQKNGWMKAPKIKNEKKLQKAIAKKEKQYEKIFNDYRVSDLRLNSLDDIVSFLSKHGRVYLVRLPTSENIQKMESEYMPSFDSKMKSLAQKYKALYLNYSKDQSYETIDANHLNSEAAIRISKVINQELKKAINAN